MSLGQTEEYSAYTMCCWPADGQVSVLAFPDKSDGNPPTWRGLVGLGGKFEREPGIRRTQQAVPPSNTTHSERE